MIAVAIARADISIAMGGMGSEAAIKTADVVDPHCLYTPLHRLASNF